MALRIREDYRTLTGREKAAIFLLALGEEHTSRLFGFMDEEEIMEVSSTMATLGKVSSTVVERLFVDFAEQMSSTGSLVGTFDSTERLLTKVLDKDKVEAIMEEIRGPAGRTMWEKLGNVNEEVLANFLMKEYPQTVAVVMSKIQPDHAARVMALLPQGFAMEVIHRMLRMESVQKDVLDDVEKTLRTEFMSNLARGARRDSYEMMAEIFNNLDRSVEQQFLQGLEESEPDSAERIRSLMFTFEDLGKLDPTSIQSLIRAIDKDKLPVALKGATEALRDLFFSNMSERAGKILREDMSALGPVRLKDVDEAQQYIVSVTKELEARGEIRVTTGKEEDELIYYAAFTPMDNKPKKYFFDNNDFDEEVMRARMRAEDEARRRPSFSQEEMEASRQTGFAQGRSEGVRETMASLEAQMVELNGHIDQALKAFDAHEDARTRVFIDQATLISSQILAKAFPVLLERLSLPQIESFLDKILQEQIKKRHIKIFVPTRYAEPLNEKIAALASLAPHGNSWTVEPREALSSYQCEIEWDGGGATWNPEQVTTQALKTLLAHIPEALPENDLALLNENEDGQAIDESAENTHNDTDVATT